MQDPTRTVVRQVVAHVVFRFAAAKTDKICCVTANDTEAAGGKTNERDEETDTRTDGERKRLGHDADEPLPETDEGEEEENPALEEDSRERFAVGDDP